MLKSLPSSEAPGEEVAERVRRLREEILRLTFRLVVDLMVLKAESEVGRVRGYGNVGGSPLNIDALGVGEGDEGSMSAVQSL